MYNNEYVDVHILETVPPSCVNRDDTGSPKTAVYGGVVRARVSSQCWKKAVREYFRELFAEADVGKRTKYVHRLLTEEIEKRAPDIDAGEMAKAALEAAGVEVKPNQKKKEELETNALFFVSQSQLDALADYVTSHPIPQKPDDKKDKEKEKEYKRQLAAYKQACKDALMSSPTIDIALFGRMVAMKEEEKGINFDATAQVAHAISTHAVHNEYDYFTAVDDCAPEDNAGAGHLGTVEYNSATLYRYATVNVRELRKYLGDRTPEAVRAFVEAFVYSMPTGKINTFANNVPPDAVYVTFRRDRPINLVGAFEKPIQAKDSGYGEPSREAFVEHAKAIYADYLGEPERALSVSIEVGDHCEKMTLPALLDAVEGIVRENGGQA